MMRGEHRATRPVGPAEATLPDPSGRARWRWRHALIVWVVLAIVAAVGGGLAGVRGTSALFSATAPAQTATITAGTWGPQTPPPASCKGTFEFAIHTSSRDFDSHLQDDSIVYVDSDGTFDFKFYKHLCLIVSVWHVIFRHLYKDCFLAFLFPKAWLCFPFPSLSTCGWVGDDDKSSSSESSDGRNRGLGLFALRADDASVPPALDDSFGEHVQSDIAAGDITDLTIQQDATSDAPSSKSASAQESSSPASPPRPATNTATSDPSTTAPAPNATVGGSTSAPLTAPPGAGGA